MKTELPPLRKIRICQPCLDGQGQECHTPRCALFLHRVDIPVHRELYETVEEPALPAPQPGGGGEGNGRKCSLCDGTGTAESVTCPRCAGSGQYLSLAFTPEQIAEMPTPLLREYVEQHSPTPPIALPVRAEAGTPRTDVAKFGVMFGAIVGGAFQVKIPDGMYVQAGDCENIERDLRHQIAALSRELEEARRQNGQLASTLRIARECHTRSVEELNITLFATRAELEEAKAEVVQGQKLLRHIYDNFPADGCKGAFDRVDLASKEINTLRAELTALRAAPRSEGSEKVFACCEKHPANGSYLFTSCVMCEFLRLQGALCRISRLIQDDPKKNSDYEENDDTDALVELVRASLAPRSETEGRDKERWQPIGIESPAIGEIVWLFDGNRAWIGGRADSGDGSWLWGQAYSWWHNGQKWDGDIEQDDDYKPTHYQPLPALAHDEKGAGE